MTLIRSVDKQTAFDSIRSGKLLLVYGTGSAVEAHACLEDLGSVMLGYPVIYASLPRTFRGKPHFTEQMPCFSISHTESSFIIGFCSYQEIGVDMEMLVPDMDMKAMADYAFSPDEREILQHYPNANSFLKIWTMKEAYLKATGIGLIDALPTLHVVTEPTFDIMDPLFSSFQYTGPKNEIVSVVCKGKMPEILILNR